MKIDFERTEAELSNLLDDVVSSLIQEYPDVAIRRLGLWGLSFSCVAKVLVDAEDNSEDFGREPNDYQYEENEYGDGLIFEWWPDLYALDEGDHYEISYKNGWEFDPSLLEGDDEINIPLFALFMTVLESTSFDRLKRADQFELSAEIGAHWLKVAWVPGECPDVSATVAYLASEFQAGEAGLRPAISTTHDELRYRISTLNTNERAIVSSVAFYDDRTLLALGPNGRLEIWDVESGGLLWQSDESPGSDSMKFCKKTGLALTYGMDESVTLWSIPERKIKKEFPVHEDGICSAAMSGDGNHLATADEDGLVRLWSEPFGGKSVIIGEGLRIVGELAFSHDGELLTHVSNGGDKCVILYDLRNGSSTPILVEHEPWPSTAAFSPDGKLLATGSSKWLWFWNLHERRTEHHHALDSEIAEAIEFSPDSSILAGAGQDKAIVFWDAETGEKLLTIANPSKHHTVRCLAFSPDGAILASSNSDGTIDLWDMHSAIAK